MLDVEPEVFCRNGMPSQWLARNPHKQWFVGQVRHNWEKMFARMLGALRISYFLPMQAGRLLLPGFVFFLGSVEDLYKAFDTKRMWHVIKTNDQIGIRRDLRRFAIAMSSLPFNHNDSIQTGVRVRIVGHPIKGLNGLEATVDSRDKNRIWLNIQLVGSGSFEIDVKYLEIVP